MPKVKFSRNTVHPDYGEVAKGEVVIVTRDYVRDYAALEIAVETDEEATRPAPAEA